MTESNSQPVRCPCGFFGSSQTNGLCSKCFNEYEQKRNERTTPGLLQHPADAASSTASATSNAFHDNSTNIPSESADEKRDVEVESRVTLQDDDSPTDNSSSGSNDKRGVKRKHGEVEETETQQEESPPAHKTRCRCFLCHCRLPPALSVIGKCRCENLFCPLHRLPEQHNCMFDHKESGRAAARAKMVPYQKQVGTSLKRLDPQ